MSTYLHLGGVRCVASVSPLWWQVWIGARVCEIVQLHSTPNQIVCKTPPSEVQHRDQTYVVSVVVDGTTSAVCSTVPKGVCTFRYRDCTYGIWWTVAGAVTG